MLLLSICEGSYNNLGVKGTYTKENFVQKKKQKKYSTKGNHQKRSIRNKNFPSQMLQCKAKRTYT